MPAAPRPAKSQPSRVVGRASVPPASVSPIFSVTSGVSVVPASALPASALPASALPAETAAAESPSAGSPSAGSPSPGSPSGGGPSGGTATAGGPSAERPAPKHAAPPPRTYPEPDPDAVVDLAGVTVTRAGNDLLHEVDWQVREDERWVVLGPNGAGKTTLLSVAAARLHPTRGRVAILGEQLGKVDVFELRPRIGLSSASLAERIPADETVADVVLTAAYGVVGRFTEQYDGVDATRGRSLLAQFGVEHLAARLYGTLSEGERKRVQIARALMTDPEVLMLDEPAAGLDLGGREDLVRRLSTLARDAAAPALVLVTHHVEEIPPGITHALLLREGKVTAAGPVAEALTAETLSSTFGLALRLDLQDGRYAARAL